MTWRIVIKANIVEKYDAIQRITPSPKPKTCPKLFYGYTYGYCYKPTDNRKQVSTWE